MERMRKKTIAGRKVTEYLFNGEVQLRLRFSESSDYDGTDVRIDVELPLTNGIKEILELGKKQVAFGANMQEEINEDSYHFSVLRQFQNLTPEQRKEMLID